MPHLQDAAGMAQLFREERSRLSVQGSIPSGECLVATHSESLALMDTGTLPTMSKAELSRVQFRELFMLHEPALFKFSDSMLEAFGRGSIAKVTIYCPVKDK